MAKQRVHLAEVLLHSEQKAKTKRCRSAIVSRPLMS